MFCVCCDSKWVKLSRTNEHEMKEELTKKKELKRSNSHITQEQRTREPSQSTMGRWTIRVNLKREIKLKPEGFFFCLPVYLCLCFVFLLLFPLNTIFYVRFCACERWWWSRWLTKRRPWKFIASVSVNEYYVLMKTYISAVACMPPL